MGSFPARVEAARAEFRGGGRGWSVVAIALGWAMLAGTMLSVPAVLPFVRAEFAVSNAQAGFAVTAMWLVYGACQFPAGLLTDRVGERRMLLGAMALGAGVAAAFATSPTLPVFVASAALFDAAFLLLAGLAAGCYLLLPSTEL